MKSIHTSRISTNRLVYLGWNFPNSDWRWWSMRNLYQGTILINSNVARIILSSLHLKWHFLCSSQIFYLCLIYGNESRNGRPSNLGIKLEMNNSALQLGICKIRLWSLKFLSAKNKNCNFVSPSVFTKISENHQRWDTSSWGDAICGQNICEYWGGFWKLNLASWYNPRKQKLLTLLSNALTK